MPYTSGRWWSKEKSDADLGAVRATNPELAKMIEDAFATHGVPPP